MTKTLLMAALGAALFLGVGCQNKKSDMDHMDHNSGTMTTRTDRSDTMQGQDDCPHCPGVQHARPDGTCPECGMQVKTASR